MKRIVDSVASRLAFFPPDPPMYEIKPSDSDPNKLLFRWATPGGGKRIVNCECQVLRLQHFKTGCGRTSSAGEICAAWLPHKRQSSLTVLFSHGNAVDLGAVLLFCNELSRDLQCNVLAYDYSGYGRSGGTPSVTTSLSDIRLCYDWLLEQGIPPSKIVLFGQSVGSGPTVDLAAKMPNLAGVVLHTPLLSGMRVLNPNWRYWPSLLDVYPNMRLIAQIKVPVLVMHGTQDEVIDIAHGKELHGLCKRPHTPFWAEGYNHQNLEMAPGYLPALRDFMRHCATRQE
ncbi:hypothetical protein WJX84_010821 [Apatococcus fuscideae]|uniref:Serine aminopeptidase S33 domain-containing protein n=1 Tax=Apatococcus fuscideae TaxID=2026836 RepID=A0AAW1TFQ2_9CHLO